GMLQQQEGDERAQHVLGAMREVDDIEHAENNGEPETEQRVERAVDQPDQELAEQGLRGDAEDFEHAVTQMVRPHPETAKPPFRWMRARTPRSAADQRAAAVLERTERLCSRDRGFHLVEVARVLGLR